MKYEVIIVNVFLILFLASCFSYDDVKSSQDSSSTELAIIEGYAALKGACGTTARSNTSSTCPLMPSQAPLNLESESGDILEIHPDSTGYFKVKVNSGSYTVTLAEKSQYLSAPPKHISVKSRDKVKITFKINALSQ